MTNIEKLECRYQTLNDLVEIFEYDMSGESRKKLDALRTKVNEELNSARAAGAVSDRLVSEF